MTEDARPERDRDREIETEKVIFCVLKRKMFGLRKKQLEIPEDAKPEDHADIEAFPDLQAGTSQQQS